MRLKTALVTGFLMLTMALMVGVVSVNGPVLAQPFNLLGLEVPTAWVLALAFLAGFIAFTLWLAGTGVVHWARRWVEGLRRQNERAAEEYYLKGLDAALGSRPLEAITHFQRALETSPEYLPALLKLGDALRAAGRPQEALSFHRQALSIRPEDVATLYALTEDALLLQDHEEAKRHLATILRIQPRRALKALRLLRALYIRETNWKKALEIQEHIGNARVLEEERADDAPFTAGLMYQIGADLLGQEKYKDAVAQLEKLRRKFPAFQATYLKLAEAYLLSGQEETAVDVYLDGYRKNASPMCLLAMEQLFLDKGDPEGAVRQYQNLIQTTDRKVLPKFLLGRFYYKLEVLDRAEGLFREIQGNVRQSGLLEYYLGRIRERKGDAPKACAHYREVIRVLNPFELNYTCAGCGQVSPEWRDFCSTCQRWDTLSPNFRDELLQEIHEPSPVFYQGVPWHA